jgi:hypothetical protein
VTSITDTDLGTDILPGTDHAPRLAKTVGIRIAHDTTQWTRTHSLLIPETTKEENADAGPGTTITDTNLGAVLPLPRADHALIHKRIEKRMIAFDSTQWRRTPLLVCRKRHATRRVERLTCAASCLIEAQRARISLLAPDVLQLLRLKARPPAQQYPPARPLAPRLRCPRCPLPRHPPRWIDTSRSRMTLGSTLLL